MGRVMEQTSQVVLVSGDQQVVETVSILYVHEEFACNQLSPTPCAAYR